MREADDEAEQTKKHIRFIGLLEIVTGRERERDIKV